MEQNQSLFSLSIDPVTKAHLSEAAKWARFLAIAGMVLLGLALVFSILTVTVLSNMDGIFTVNNQGSELGSAFAVSYAIGMILFFVIGFFPLLFLLHFANRLRAALAGNAQEDLTVAFQNLKKYFRYVGIILIIVLVIYGLAFVLALLGSAAA